MIEWGKRGGGRESLLLALKEGISIMGKLCNLFIYMHSCNLGSLQVGVRGGGLK